MAPESKDGERKQAAEPDKATSANEKSIAKRKTTSGPMGNLKACMGGTSKCINPRLLMKVRTVAKSRKSKVAAPTKENVETISLRSKSSYKSICKPDAEEVPGAAVGSTSVTIEKTRREISQFVIKLPPVYRGHTDKSKLQQ